jgi:hypothetical protein
MRTTTTRRGAVAALAATAAGLALAPRLVAPAPVTAPAPKAETPPAAPPVVVYFARDVLDAERGVWALEEVEDLAAAVAEGVQGRVFADCGVWATEIRRCSAAEFVEHFVHSSVYPSLTTYPVT